MVVLAHKIYYRTQTKPLPFCGCVASPQLRFILPPVTNCTMYKEDKILPEIVYWWLWCVWQVTVPISQQHSNKDRYTESSMWLKSFSLTRFSSSSNDIVFRLILLLLSITNCVIFIKRKLKSHRFFHTVTLVLMFVLWPLAVFCGTISINHSYILYIFIFILSYVWTAIFYPGWDLT